MSTNIPAVEFPEAEVYINLRPLRPTDQYLALYKNGADVGLRLAISDWMRLTEFMLDKEIAHSQIVPPDDPLDGYLEITLVACLAQIDHEPVHLTYTAVNPLDPENPATKIYLTHGFCEMLLQSMSNGQLRRFDRGLVDALKPMRKALLHSGGMLGVVLGG